MTHRRCDLTVSASLRRANYYADIEACIESQRIFVLAADLMIEVYDFAGRSLDLIPDFANLFYPTNETVSGSDLPLLSIVSTELVLADPATGTIAIYSLASRHIVFAKNIGVRPYSITGDSETGKALISCAETAVVYELDVANAEISVASAEYRKPQLVCASKDRIMTVDAATATLTIHHRKLDTVRSVSLWPSAMQRACEPPENGSWVFGVDCACVGDAMIVLQGRGGDLVPSFWRVSIETLILEAFQITENYEPIRVAMAGTDKTFFLCLDQQSQYCVCTAEA